ncbi:MAG: hypothetical protein WC471_03200 [Candidatus Woesearchaeota archaeon]
MVFKVFEEAYARLKRSLFSGDTISREFTLKIFLKCDGCGQSQCTGLHMNIPNRMAWQRLENWLLDSVEFKFVFSSDDRLQWIYVYLGPTIISTRLEKKPYQETEITESVTFRIEFQGTLHPRIEMLLKSLPADVEIKEIK